MPLVLSAQEKASFDGPFRIKTISGPLTLLRLCGRNSAMDDRCRFGRHWFNERFFWRTLDVASDSASNTAQLNHYLRLVLRESTAVCHDWNSFAAIYQLRVPASHSLECAVGRIAPQPFFSGSDPLRRQSLPHELLVGGEFQYIIDLPEGSPLRGFVSGPRPLLARLAGRAC